VLETGIGTGSGRGRWRREFGFEGKEGTQQILMTFGIESFFLYKRLLYFSYLPSNVI